MSKPTPTPETNDAIERIFDAPRIPRLMKMAQIADLARDMQRQRDALAAEVEIERAKKAPWVSDYDRASLIHRQDEQITALKAEVERLKVDYHELILAVGNKYEGETRHQTALKYIRRAEETSNTAAMQPKPTPPSSSRRSGS